MTDRMGYPPEVKAAVMAALLTGQSVGSIAEQYHLPPGTVSSWKTRASGVQSVADVAEVANQKREIGDLVLTYLKANLQTLHNQVRLFGDQEWLRQQPAGEVAVLHGVLTDKAIRLLEALASSAGQEQDV